MFQKRLMTTFVASLVVEVAIIIIYESELLLEGGLCGDANMEFLFATMMELITICLIPLSLRLFKFENVRKFIADKGAEGHYQMAMIRMMMLVIPMLINTMCYYLFMKVAFCYLAVILAISLVFIVPTKARCNSEL